MQNLHLKNLQLMYHELLKCKALIEEFIKQHSELEFLNPCFFIILT